MRADQEELAHRIAGALPRDGTVEPQPGSTLPQFRIACAEGSN